MNKEKIIEEVLKELERAKKKYPPDEYPWKGDLSIFEQAALVVVEAGEALQAANKLYFNGEGSYPEIQRELIQTISTAMRVLEGLKI